MLVDEILSAVGLPFRQTLFLKPPQGAYIVWLAESKRRGADLANCITERSVTFELYSKEPDDGAEQAVEAALDAVALEYVKYARAWLDKEGLYMTAYDFETIEKD
jgi:hypothetical protein